MKPKRFKGNTLYRADGPYDDDRPGFDCFLSDPSSDECVIADCWVCDSKGNVHPGYDCQPVPVCIERCVKILGVMTPPERKSGGWLV